jgi:hypothetical protein
VAEGNAPPAAADLPDWSPDSTHAQMRGDGYIARVAVESRPLHMTPSVGPRWIQRVHGIPEYRSLQPVAARPFSRSTLALIARLTEWRETRVVTAPACSFCGKGQQEAKQLIAGPAGVFICEACVALCVDSLAEGGVELPTVVVDNEWDVGGGWRVSKSRVVKDAGTRQE